MRNMGERSIEKARFKKNSTNKRRDDNKIVEMFTSFFLSVTLLKEYAKISNLWFNKYGDKKYIAAV